MDKTMKMIDEMKTKVGIGSKGRASYPTWQDDSYENGINAFIFDLKKRLKANNVKEVKDGR